MLLLPQLLLKHFEQMEAAEEEETEADNRKFQYDYGFECIK